MVRPIQLETQEDVEKVVKFAQTYPHQTKVSCGATTHDAMSILGLLSLVGRKDVCLVFSDHDGKNRISKINKYLRKAGIK